VTLPASPPPSGGGNAAAVHRLENDGVVLDTISRLNYADATVPFRYSPEPQLKII
jgi:hypothetical protein